MPLDASIPLRSVNQAPDPLEAASKIYTLKAAKQQAEMGDMQLHDSMSLRQAAQDPSVQGPDGSINFESLMSGAVKRGVSTQTLMILSKASEEQKTRKLQMEQKRQEISGKLHETISKSAAALLPQIDELAKTVGLDAAIKQFEPQLKQVSQEVDPMYQALGVPHPPLDFSQTDKMYQGIRAAAAQYKPMSQAETITKEETRRHNIATEAAANRRAAAAERAAGGVDAVPPSLADVHGTDYLKKLSAGEASLVKGIAEGRINPSSLSTRGGHREKVLQQVAQYDPTFDATTFGTRAGVRKDFTSGPTSKNITAINTAIGHVGTLSDLSDALNNKDTRAFNAVVNRIQTELGNPNVNNFDTAKAAVGNELMRVFRQVGASETETKDWEAKFSSANSPAQLKGAIKVAVELLHSRIIALNDTYNRGMGVTTGFPDIVSPKSRKVLEHIGSPLEDSGGGTKKSSRHLGTYNPKTDSFE